MSAEPRRITPRSEMRSSGNVTFEVISAIGLIVLAIIGAALALEARIYLGEALTDRSATAILQRVAAAPNIGSITSLLISVGLGVTGFIWFPVRLIHWRFFSPVDSRRVWRQAIFVALFTVSSAWLQLNRAFTLSLAAIMLGVLVLVEIFLNIRGA
jgi:hypothetical protein